MFRQVLLSRTHERIHTYKLTHTFVALKRALHSMLGNALVSLASRLHRHAAVSLARDWLIINCIGIRFLLALFKNKTNTTA